MNFPFISSKGRPDTLLAKTLPLSHPPGGQLSHYP